MKKIPLALQLYSVREKCEKDFEGTLKAVKEIGYDGVELAGFNGWDPGDLNALCRDLGLIIYSAHVGRKELLKDLSGAAALYEALGCNFIAFPWSDRKTELPGASGYEAFKEDTKKIAEALKKHGIRLLYHNHDFEMELLEGKTLLDIMLRDLPEIGSELDLCWARVGGKEPSAYLLELKGRVPVVHFKDYTGKTGGNMYNLIGQEPAVGEKPEGFHFTALGEGVQNIGELVKASLEAGAEIFVVEQDEPAPGKDSLDEAAKSFETLKLECEKC